MYLVRSFKNGDEKQIVWLINNTWRDAYKDIFPSVVFDERDKTADKRIEAFESNLIKNNRICYVIKEGDKIVAAMIGSLKTDILEFDAKNYARLIALYVDKNYQHMGLGKQLFDKFVEVLKQRNAKNFIIGVLEKNIKARKAYEKWGGILTNYSELFTVCDVSRTEVFYKYDVNNINS